MSTEVAEKEVLVLEHLRDLCYRAHSFTSFSPEKRATYYVEQYSEQLKADLLLLGDSPGNYKEKYISKFSDWMGAKSRCISSMITGPSNFPVRKARKANQSEHNRYEDFVNWRERYFQAVNRVPTKSPEDDKELAGKKLERLVNVQMEMKLINSEIRRVDIKELKPLTAHLVGEGFDPVLVSLIDNFYSKNTQNYKIRGFVLSNNNAKIKAAEQKIKTMETRIQAKDSWQDIIFDGGRVTIENDRVCIFHDSKPERETIQEIKKSGFRWSPNWACWCRKHTRAAIYSAENLSFIKAA
tara:strand:- start:13940 stop:14830 length:891 start_codon:yes stop_codon:yes gene_type:complete